MGDRVLVIGGGGREHSLAWKLTQSNHVSRVFLAPGNAGSQDSFKMENLPLSCVDPNDNKSVVKYCSENNIDFVVVGPEVPLANGLADCLNEANIPCFGPTKAAARIESSKAFAKDFMQRYAIPTAKWKAFTNADQACEHIRTADYQALVVKASGLAAGKGVIVAQDKEEAMMAVKEILEDKKFGEAGSTVVIEEKLEGDEVSVLAFTDGKIVAPMPPSQDHKQLLDGDMGPNTGGMGAYTPCPLVTTEMKDMFVKEVLQKAVDGMREEGCAYVGVLYAGLMLTSDGPKVLEFNCRFGDPETQSILPLLASDLYATMMECVNGELELSMPSWHTDKCTVGVVAASGGYPGTYKKGCVIHGLQDLKVASDILVFHAGTTHKETEKGRVTVTSGGRVLAVVGVADSVSQAKAKAYEAMNKICFDGIQYRKDIAQKAVRGTGLTYSDSGVNIEAGNQFVKAIKPLAAATSRSGCSAELGGFGGFFDPKAAGFKDPILVSGTDGVGTKLKIAQLCGRHDTVGIDLVAMCVNDILAHGAEPLFFLDYFATGKLDPGLAKEVVCGIAKGCTVAGCALLGGETAEMPDMYSGGEYDIAGFAVGAVERDRVLPRTETISPGDAVIGLGSSGVHSNGFSLVRKIADMTGLSFDSPCPFPTVEGFQSVTTLGEALLTPTRIYCKAVLPQMHAGKVKAFAHITGGGLVENVPRILPKEAGVILDASAWSMPPVFGWISSQGNVPASEMLKTFNCGIGGVLIVDKSHATELLDALRQSDEKAWLIGEVVKCSESDNRVIVNNIQESLAVSAANTTGLSTRTPVNGTLEGAAKKLKLSNGNDGHPTMKIGVLISGSGTNLQALIDRSLRHDSHADIVLVVSNVPGVQGLKRAENAGIPTKVIKHKDFKSRLEFDMAVQAALEEAGVELVCLAGFMRIVTGEFVRKWNGRLLNIHPSLLPSFKGMNAHKLVLEAGVCISGCTVHFVAEEVDAGAIITQEVVPVLPGDSVETLQERVKTAEHRAYPRAVELLASGRLRLGENNKVQWLS